MKLPGVSGKDVIKALAKDGYYVHDQKGSHVHLRHLSKRPLTVPYHDTIARGTLKEIIKQAELTVDEFIRLLRK